jgi:hypothetical protein
VSGADVGGGFAMGGLPRRAVWLKQNCGVNAGVSLGGPGRSMVVVSSLSGVLAERRPRVQSRPAVVVVEPLPDSKRYIKLDQDRAGILRQMRADITLD